MAAVEFTASAEVMEAGVKSGGVTRVRMNPKGVISILKSAGVRADISRRLEAIRSALPTGDGEVWEAETFTGFDRVQGVVRTGNAAARRTNAERMALTRALDRGR